MPLYNTFLQTVLNMKCTIGLGPSTSSMFYSNRWDYFTKYGSFPFQFFYRSGRLKKQRNYCNWIPISDLQVFLTTALSKERWARDRLWKKKRNTSPGLVDPILNRLYRRLFHSLSFYFIIFGQFLITGRRGNMSKFPIFLCHILTLWSKNLSWNNFSCGNGFMSIKNVGQFKFASKEKTQAR